MPPSKMTTTSYAILGLLAIKPWTTYELAQQVRVRMRRFWSRAASKWYEEPKKLPAQGLAVSEADRVGKRRRTTYSLTPAGREQLARWLAEPGGSPVVEFEALLKVFFAEYGTRADLLATPTAVQEGAAEQLAEDADTARRYLGRAGQFPERTARLVLVGRFLSDFAEMTGRWAQWAAGETRQWPDDVREATPDWQALRKIADRKAGQRRSRPDPRPPPSRHRRPLLFPGPSARSPPPHGTTCEPVAGTQRRQERAECTRGGEGVQEFALAALEGWLSAAGSRRDARTKRHIRPHGPRRSCRWEGSARTLTRGAGGAPSPALPLVAGPRPPPRPRGAEGRS